MAIKLCYLLLTILVKNIFIAAGDNGACEQCGEEIDTQLAKLRETPDIPIILDIVPKSLSCNITGLTRMTRDPTKLVCPQNTTNGTTYGVTVTVDEVGVYCDFNVSTAVITNVMSFVSFLIAQLQNKCPLIKFALDATTSGISSGLITFQLPPTGTCSNALTQTLLDPIGTLTSPITNEGVVVKLIGYIKNFTYTPTVVVQNNFSTLQGFQVGHVETQNFKMWCEGANANPGFIDACTCVFGTNMEQPLIVGLLSFFMTCFPNLDAYTTGGYAKIANALTCDY